MKKLDIGAVTAYAMAVKKGYEGTEEEFAALQAESGNNAVRAEAAADRAQQILDSIPLDFQEVSQGVATLTEEIDGKVMAGVGKFSTDDWLPLVYDLNEATPNRIVAIAKADYSANTPGRGGESQGTLIPFAYRNSTGAECQVQLFVTPTEKLYFRNKWGVNDEWNPWVLVATSAELTNAVKNSVSGIGQFVTSDSLPLIKDANDVTPNTILAIAKANYVQNMPGRQGDSQGTLMHFAFANRDDANCQVQLLVTPERKVWVRNIWAIENGWSDWVELETKVAFYVGGGDKATHTRLIDAINDANALPDHIHVDIMVCQNVNLYEELGGADYVASFTDATNPNAGPTLRTNVDLIGVGMPSIRLECPDDVATYNFTYSVSPLNLKGANKLSGIVFVGKNTRYVIHDEGGGHGDYNRIVENCYFYHNGTFDGGWYSGQAYGAGTGHSGAYLFDGCVFESPKTPFSIHNNHNTVRPIVKFVNCVFKGGAGYPGARFGTYGSGYVEGSVYVNGCRSSGTIRTVTEGDYETFNDTGFQIIAGSDVYRTDLNTQTRYVGKDVWSYEKSYTDVPLSDVTGNAGMSAIFRKFCCIGDSLASGEHEYIKEDGKIGYIDLYEYSWGQYMARAVGGTCYNLSKGGATTRTWLAEFASRLPETLSDCYIIALGVNDANPDSRNVPVGSLADCHATNHTLNADTYYGNYDQIIRRIHTVQPRAKIFCVTNPQGGANAAYNNTYNKAVRDMVTRHDNCYLIDLWEHAPVYDAAFREMYFNGGHMNAAGYLYTAHMFMSYIDWYVKNNPTDFAEVAFIGTDYSRQ